MKDKTSPNKKILLFIPASTGGAERVTIIIAKMLKQAGFIPKLVIVDHKRGDIENFIPADIEIDFLRCSHIPFSLPGLLRYIRKEKPYKTFCSLGHLTPFVILASRLNRVPVIIRNDLSLKDEYLYALLLRKITYPMAQWNISQTDEMRDDYIKILKLNPQKSVVLQNPVDKDQISQKLLGATSPYPEDNKQINYLWVGRFHYNKGQDVLAKAFLKVCTEKENAHLYFVGNYNEDDEFFINVKNSIKDIAYRVHFIGFDSNPYRWMKYADCFVLPSRKEGLPNSLLEAMYLGRPAVAARCLPVIDRIVDEGKNGYVVPVDDDEAMAEAMIKALSLKDCNLSFQSAKDNQYVELFH